MPRKATFSTKIAIPKEDEEQVKLVATLQRLNIPHFAIPNGGKRTMVQAVKMKRTGLVAGIPDLCIPVPRSPYHGLFIEMKRVHGGTVSENQKYWIARLKELGYQAVVCAGYDEAWMELQIYFNGNFKC